MKETNKSLLAGLAVLIATVAIVAIVGLLAIKPQKEMITGEADASEYRVSNMVPGHIDSICSQQVQMAYQVWQKAQAAEEVYRKSYERVKGLKEKGVVSAQQYDEVEAKYKVAQADCAAAEQQYLMAKEGAQVEDKDAAAALVGRATGAVAEVQSYLDDSYLIAPCDGEVVEIFAKLGDLIGTGSPVLSILDMSDCWFFFAVREDMLGDIKTGQTVMVRIPALGEQTYPCAVSRVQAMASYATWRATKTNGQYDVKSFDVKVVPLLNIEGLRPGMTAIIVDNE